MTVLTESLRMPYIVSHGSSDAVSHSVRLFGSALAAEGIFAFFLESSFLVLLFGWDKVSRGMHFFATCMVCLGAHFRVLSETT